jgi:hypothetical protein
MIPDAADNANDFSHKSNLWLLPKETQDISCMWIVEALHGFCIMSLDQFGIMYSHWTIPAQLCNSLFRPYVTLCHGHFVLPGDKGPVEKYNWQ